MKQSIIYALDFDGVICDSAVETGVTAWKAAAQIWDDLETSQPSQELLEKFRLVRPVLETGYEAILIIRLLADGEPVESILNNYSEKIHKVMGDSDLKLDSLKKLFGETRDNWIADDLDDWIAMNPLFPGVTEKLKSIVNQGVCYIITTKQERFVKQILSANQIALSGDRIFGLDRDMSKEAVLFELINKHSPETIFFVEDRLPTLLNIVKNADLKSVELFFALWGYNTSQDKIDAQEYAIKSIDIEHFPGMEL